KKKKRPHLLPTLLCLGIGYVDRIYFHIFLPIKPTRSNSCTFILLGVPNAHLLFFSFFN
ncbi:unnamed protein product, partial [Prunus brigantina]